MLACPFPDFPEGAVWPMRAPRANRQRTSRVDRDMAHALASARVLRLCARPVVPKRAQTRRFAVRAGRHPRRRPFFNPRRFRVDECKISAPDPIGAQMKARVLVLPLLIVALFPLALADMEPISGYATTKQTITAGSGPVVAKGDTVTVHATGIVEEGNKKFWSTKDPGQKPFTYQAGVGAVITGWDQGCLGMNVGETRKLRIPAHEGYGAGGFPAWGIPPGGTLLFEIEVLSIKGKGGEL